MPTTSKDEVGSGRAAYMLRPSARDFSPSQSLGEVVGRVLSGHFRIGYDVKVEEAVRSLDFDLGNQVLSNTQLLARNVRRSDLRDPLGLINADRDAVALIRAGARRSRFVVVSGVSYSDGLALRYSGRLLPNTLNVGDLHLHVDYECPATAIIRSEAESDENETPVVFFYAPIMYDDTSQSVKFDTRPIDLPRFDIAATF